MRYPPVAVIIPTWDRHHLLTTRALSSVWAQDYPGVVHPIVVSDGPDPLLRSLIDQVNRERDSPHRAVVFHVPGPKFDDDGNYGARARNTGLVITGVLPAETLVAYLDDDNAYRPHHLRVLADTLLTDTSAEFAYSRMHVNWHGGDYEVGAEPPHLGGIDTSLIMHRRDTTLRYGEWPYPGTIHHCPDWELVETWIARGATWAHIPQITVDYWRNT